VSIPMRRRFWSAAIVTEEGEGFGVRLDARPLRTPAEAPLVVPTRALAEAIAGEWGRVEGEIRPEKMPLTRAVNTSIDGVVPNPRPVVEAVAEYGGSDLLCYRAEGPEGLRQRQFAAWDPLLAWSAEALGAPLVAVMGVMHVPQPAESLERLASHVAAEGPFRLTGLSELVTLSGSLVIGLAVARGALDAETAWAVSRIDEAWQEEQWGRDAEAAAAAEARREAFLRAARYLELLEGQGPQKGEGVTHA
jgi:chaperone required for assembly of F1-ATPase